MQVRDVGRGGGSLLVSFLYFLFCIIENLGDLTNIPNSIFCKFSIGTQLCSVGVLLPLPPPPDWTCACRCVHWWACVRECLCPSTGLPQAPSPSLCTWPSPSS